MKRLKKTIILLLAGALWAPQTVLAQVGEHRDDLSVGVNGGYVLNSVGFSPRVSQGMHGGLTGGLSFRYVCEKYFSTICSVMAEVNYASLGWKEDILNSTDQPVINPVTGLAEAYSRTINYVQVPVFAHLAWGKELKGFQFFFQAGPQFGVFLSESTSSNFDLASPYLPGRSNKTHEQYKMQVESKFDYGIAGGMGMEYTMPHVGHFLLEGRYYYGLGNIYGSSKRDFFGKSYHGSIVIKLTYLTDLIKTK